MSDPTRCVVLVTSRSFASVSPEPADRLRRRGLEVRRAPADHALDALVPLLNGAQGWIAGVGAVTDAHLACAPRLRILARCGVGVDAVDLDAARRRGVVVTNTPGANTAAVADHTIALMLTCLRHVVDSDRDVRAGRWQPRRGRELGVLTVGLVGFGRVGQAVAARLRGFGSTMLACDPFVDPDRMRDHDIEPVALDELASRADVVSLHCPPGPRPVVDADLLERMQPGVLLINTARGALLDEQAVAHALAQGRLAGLGADVVAAEPPSDSPLLGAPRTLITPHCAAHSDEAIDRMGLAAADEVVRVLIDHQPARHPVDQEGEP